MLRIFLERAVMAFGLPFLRNNRRYTFLSRDLFVFDAP
ncbi:hypothetical protein ASZ90_013739 [hydrocarbon metagenome]|uniref:Uncharacterized protein n=1 Tax=hydrocarbon metagenome TaxID=938273 RepID=A0A0W8F6U2_9ZZZZ